MRVKTLIFSSAEACNLSPALFVPPWIIYTSGHHPASPLPFLQRQAGYDSREISLRKAKFPLNFTTTVKSLLLRIIQTVKFYDHNLGPTQASQRRVIYPLYVWWAGMQYRKHFRDGEERWRKWIKQGVSVHLMDLNFFYSNFSSDSITWPI